MMRQQTTQRGWAPASWNEFRCALNAEVPPSAHAKIKERSTYATFLNADDNTVRSIFFLTKWVSYNFSGDFFINYEGFIFPSVAVSEKLMLKVYTLFSALAVCCCFFLSFCPFISIQSMPFALLRTFSVLNVFNCLCCMLHVYLTATVSGLWPVDALPNK